MNVVIRQTVYVLTLETQMIWLPMSLSGGWQSQDSNRGSESVLWTLTAQCLILQVFIRKRTTRWFAGWDPVTWYHAERILSRLLSLHSITFVIFYPNQQTQQLFIYSSVWDVFLCRTTPRFPFWVSCWWIFGCFQHSAYTGNGAVHVCMHNERVSPEQTLRTGGSRFLHISNSMVWPKRSY